MNLSFAAIDFETATGYMGSACAVGIVTVTDGEITDEYYRFNHRRMNIGVQICLYME